MTGAGHTLPSSLLSFVRIFPKTKPRATPAGPASLLAPALQGFVNSDPPGLAELTAVKGRPLSTYTHTARLLLRAGPPGECRVRSREGGLSVWSSGMASGQWPPRGEALRRHLDQEDGSGAWSSPGEGPGAEGDKLQVAHCGWNSELVSGGLGGLGVRLGLRFILRMRRPLGAQALLDLTAPLCLGDLPCPRLVRWTLPAS